MAKDERRQKIAELENKLGSKVICFLTSDRTNMNMLITRDCTKVIQQHLNLAESHKKISLFIVSHGGDLDVPWDLVNLLRSHCTTLQVVIPYVCYSAATLATIGCDEIVAGPRAQLSPSDPTLQVRTGTDAKSPTMQFGVEDINAFIQFVRQTLGRSFPRYGHEALSKLIDTVPPHLLGSINRNYFRIRLLIAKMLRLSSRKYTAAARDNIIELLTVSYFSHQHVISRREMIEDLGLPVIPSEKLKVNDLIWDLYEEYATEFESRKPLDLQGELHGSGTNPFTLELKGKFVESLKRTDAYIHTMVVSGTGLPNFNFTTPKIEGVSQETLQQVIQHFSTELQKQLKPFLVAKTIATFGEWKTE